MKVWELEAGKVYTCEGLDSKYRKGTCGFIERLNNFDNIWYPSQNTYNQMIELDFTEYEESVDWSKVEVDTKILVRDYSSTSWTKRYFAKFKNGFVCAFQDGRTSFSNNDSYLHSWNYAKLYKETDDEK